jgi:hypothetical protein
MERLYTPCEQGSGAKHSMERRHGTAGSEQNTTGSERSRQVQLFNTMTPMLALTVGHFRPA